MIYAGLTSGPRPTVIFLRAQFSMTPVSHADTRIIIDLTVQAVRRVVFTLIDYPDKGFWSLYRAVILSIVQNRGRCADKWKQRSLPGEKFLIVR